MSVDTVAVSTYYVDMNITLSVDERIVERARAAAASEGMSLNQAVRRFLEELAGGDSAEADIAELERLSNLSRGNPQGWKFNRDEIHERS